MIDCEDDGYDGQNNLFTFEFIPIEKEVFFWKKKKKSLETDIRIYIILQFRLV